MGLVNNQHYLASLSDGNLWHFYLEKEMLGYHLVAHQTLMHSLIENVLDFDLCLDDSDQVHLICLTGEGLLTYFCGRPGMGWDVTPLLRYDVKSYLFGYLTLKVFFPQIHVLWATARAMKSPTWSLWHAYWTGEEWKDNLVANIVNNGNFPSFCLAEDHRQNLHLLYVQEGSEAFYNRFEAASGRWGGAEKVALSSPEMVFMLPDRNGVLHFVYRKSGSNGFEICHQQRDQENHRVIRECYQEAGWPLMFLYDNILYVVWQEGGSFFTSYFEEREQAWSAPRPLRLGPGRTVCFTYLTNSPVEKGILRMPLMFGSWGGRNGLVFNEFLYLAILQSKAREKSILSQPAFPQKDLSKLEPAGLLKLKNRRVSVPKRLPATSGKSVPFLKNYSSVERYAAEVAGLKHKYELLSREILSFKREKERLIQQQEKMLHAEAYFQEMIDKLQKESFLLSGKLQQILNQQTKEKTKKEAVPRVSSVVPVRIVSPPAVIFRSKKQA